MSPVKPITKKLTPWGRIIQLSKCCVNMRNGIDFLNVTNCKLIYKKKKKEKKKWIILVYWESFLLWFFFFSPFLWIEYPRTGIFWRTIEEAHSAIGRTDEGEYCPGLSIPFDTYFSKPTFPLFMHPLYLKIRDDTLFVWNKPGLLTLDAHPVIKYLRLLLNGLSWWLRW